MKTILSTLLVCLSVGLFAQNATNLQQIDARARKYYSDSEILQMTPLKLAQVNFIYAQSFVINHDKPCPECPEVDLSKVDVGSLKREAKRRTRHYQTVPGHPIDMLSYEELDAELQRIAAEFSTNTH